MSALCVLLLGDSQPAEMRGVLAMLDRNAPQAIVERADCISQAMALIADADWHPDLVVILQSWSKQFTVAEVHEMIGRLPLARWVCCFGAWCESDGRNHTIWPVSIRVPARSAECRIRAELRVLTEGTRALPLTASRDEVFEFDHAHHGVDVAIEAPVSVVSPDVALRDYLKDVLCASTEDLNESLDSTGTVVVWDVDPWNDERATQLQQHRTRNPHQMMIALMALAHPKDEQRLYDCGIDLVLPKLIPAWNLLAAIREHAAYPQIKA